ncbi:MAG TPA: PQQ-binding-like beta-propeller repeat protein [Rhizomicrobium sp.]|jgi:outer membrane protein assembly factor BamB|nr:PQQ-binding-like beta-propeller repeat protein [Rhizomicrobium sp.]
MKLRAILTAAVIATAAISLTGCNVLDTVGGWFASDNKKSKLRGERISVMALDESMQVDASLKDTPVVLPPPYANDAWPQPGGYASNAMYHLQASGPLNVLWEQDAGKGSDTSSQLTAAPVVADGRVFVLDSAAHVFAFDAKSGKPLWGKTLAPKGGSASFINTATFGMFGTDTRIDPTKGFGGGVAYDDGKIFATTGFGNVVAMDASNGKELWKTELGVPIVNAPTANGGRVFVSSSDNHFVALAETDGRQLWDHTGITVTAGILNSTSAAVAGDFVVVPYSSGELFALRSQNGRLSWSDTLTRSGTITALSELDDIAGRPVIDRDLVFAISHSGVMAAVRLSTGDRAWSRDITSVQTPWVAGDFIYVLTTDAQVLCLTRGEGKVKWMHQLQRWVDDDSKGDPIVWAGPVLVSDRLILVSSHGTAVSVSPYTGELLGRVDIPGGVFIAPVVANGTMYLYTNRANLVALR